ncbi:hypothetical protein AVEN_99004-1 [Araneus ventricosus]|uniref:Uncharacterized protein n=1 Tax=Araneus ventricosus TaxID=182803 RepID=A0A4Y2VP69_ARAVE|nr:hypothetical protein AVEN_71010-1 [Araneus ventricosus]GBO23222.1 hypothetical protein AVEN_119863-1 [Araneus ventricosus]GBO26218.1 hypothetical protein AVEN_189549-1 [Araneus ventricosus]GBO26230.1 hypothetical protein AVEN_99004-1 [Araneus ventricosus]
MDFEYCYEHGKSLPSNVSLMGGKRVLQRYVLECRENGVIDPRPSPQIWQRNVGSQKYWNFLDISIRDRGQDLTRCLDVTSRPVGEIIKDRARIYSIT